MADLAHRGQMVLITAFVLAVTFVGLALVINSAIFTENLASRGETSGSSETLHMAQEVRHGVGRAIEYANVHNDSSYGSDAHESLNESVIEATKNISSWTSQQQATSGRIVNISVVSQTNGTRIADNSSAGSNFTSADFDKTWTLIYNGGLSIGVIPDDNVNQVRNFRINITDRNNLTSFGTGSGMCSDEFCVNVTDAGITGSNDWLMNVTLDSTSNEVTIGVRNESTVLTCSTPVSNPVIDVTEGELGGKPCYALREIPFGDGVTPPYMINFTNSGSDSITGNYSLVVDKDGVPEAAQDPGGIDRPESINTSTEGDFTPIKSKRPFARPAIYSVTVKVEYITESSDHVLKIRVAPGEPDG